MRGYFALVTRCYPEKTWYFFHFDTSKEDRDNQILMYPSSTTFCAGPSPIAAISLICHFVRLPTNKYLQIKWSGKADPNKACFDFIPERNLMLALENQASVVNVGWSSRALSPGIGLYEFHDIKTCEMRTIKIPMSLITIQSFQETQEQAKIKKDCKKNAMLSIQQRHVELKQFGLLYPQQGGEKRNPAGTDLR